ncbi:MAG: hypothetical protein IKH55_02060 [Fibrobacter sp.]|nr:hypothetical protein [Fibrobacter sp.]
MAISVDTILQRMIVDAYYMNPNLEGTITQGTETYIRFAAAASAIWGLYKQLDWTVDQIFPSTMSKESLEKFATDRGKNVDSLTASELLTYVLDFLRRPPSGGKASDYERWALETTSIGTVAPMTPSMISSSGGINLDSAALCDSKNTESIGFKVGGSNVGNSVIVDFGSSKRIFGAGLGVTTSRGAEFRVYSSTDGTSWTQRSSLSAERWSMDTFTAVEAQYWKVELHAIDSLESWMEPELHDVRCYGIEFYTNDDQVEQPSYAKTLKNAYGIGTMAILLAPVSLSMRAVENVRKHCEEEGPVAPKEIFVSVQRETPVNVRVTVDGFNNFEEGLFRTQVEQYFAELRAGDKFVAAQLIVFVIKSGGVDAVVETSVAGSPYVETFTLNARPEQKFVLGTLTVEG